MSDSIARPIAILSLQVQHRKLQERRSGVQRRRQRTKAGSFPLYRRASRNVNCSNQRICSSTPSRCRNREGWCSIPAIRAGSCPPPRLSPGCWYDEARPPRNGLRSSSRTANPASASAHPAASPASPPPTMATLVRFSVRVFAFHLGLGEDRAHVRRRTKPFPEHAQLLARRQPHALAEDVVVPRYDLLHQPAIDLHQRPQRRLAVVIDQRNQFLRRLVILQRALAFHLQHRLQALSRRRCRHFFRRNRRTSAGPLPADTRAPSRIFLHVAQNVRQLERDARALRKLLRPHDRDSQRS